MRRQLCARQADPTSVFQFQGETIYWPSGIRDHKSERVRLSMIYSSHGRSTLRYIVVDGRIVAIEMYLKRGRVEFCSSLRVYDTS